MKAPTMIAAFAAMFAISAHAADITKPDVITGKMHIDFNTRNRGFLDSKGNPTDKATDIYKITQQLKVLDGTTCSMGFDGTVIRFPMLPGFLGSSVGARQAGYLFKIDFNYKGTTNVGNWSGFNQVDKNGIYNPQAGGNKFSLTKGSVIGDFPFTGMLYGKTPKGGAQQSFLQAAGNKVNSIVNGKPAQLVLNDSDPLGFQSYKMPAGPSTVCSHEVVVNGYLKYSYDSGNWYADKLKIKDNSTGKEDTISGGIKWQQNDHGGTYVFNLMVNQATSLGISNADDQFASAAQVKETTESADDQFATDNSIPALNGTMVYEDVTEPKLDTDGRPVVKNGEPQFTTLSSDVTYHIGANKLTENQVYALFKIIMVGIGPMNDD